MVADTAGSKGFYHYGNRFSLADCISDLDFALIGITAPDDIPCDLTCHVGSGAVNLGRVFAGEGTASDPADTAVGVTGEFSSGHAAVSLGTADDETPGGIDELLKVCVQTILRSGQDHQRLNDGTDVLRGSVLAVLHGAEEGGDAATLIIIADLGFCIRFEHFAVQAFQVMDEACRNRKRNREHLRGFIGGIAKHDALIAGTAFVYTKSDVSRLLADHAFHFESLIAEFVNADTVHDLADQFCIVRLMAAGDLSGDNDGVVFDQAFYRHATVLVMGEAVRDNRICDLVADLIHMTTGYLL